MLFDIIFDDVSEIRILLYVLYKFNIVYDRILL